MLEMEIERDDAGGRGGGGGDRHGSPPPPSGGGGGDRIPLHEGFRRNPPRNSLLMKKSSLRALLRRLDSSSRLSITCSGSDLGQLYLSGPEQDALQLLGGDGDIGPGRRSSWLRAADLYGRRRSFRRMGSYANFLEDDWMGEIAEEDERKGSY